MSRLAISAQPGTATSGSGLLARGRAGSFGGPDELDGRGALQRPAGGRGRVILVGAGPGDPDLLTLRAIQRIRDADVVVFDHLVGSDILDLIPVDTQRIYVGKRAGHHTLPQDRINQLLVELAGAGACVVRLKGGDPFVFGRGGEEVEALRDAGVSYSVVPGITAALGAAADFEVPLTYRREALRVTFLTAHRADDAAKIDWSTLTDLEATVVAYMGMTAAPAIRDGLIAAGRSPRTPVGVFARATRPDAQAAVGVLADLPALVRRIDGGPALLVIGDVVAHSAPWRAARLAQTLPDLMMAAE